MKIIYYCDWFEEYTASLALQVAESNEVALIVRKESPEFANRRGDEAELHRALRERGVDLYVLGGKYWSFPSVLAITRIYRRKRKAGYTVFHLQNTGDPRFAWLALRMPTTLTVHEPKDRHGLNRETGRARQLTSAVMGRFYRCCADLIVVHTQSNLMNLMPTERKKALIIPHGVTVSSPLPAAPSKTILFFGRAAAYKGIDTLFAAMHEVWKSEPSAQLRILASPGDHPCDRLPSDGRVHATWGGYSSQELDLELANARAVCLPYTSASGSGVGAQAYGSGKPIVASDLEGLRELVAHKELLARPTDPKDLARALIAVLRNDFGPQRVDLDRTWPKVADAHIAAYRSLSGGAR